MQMALTKRQQDILVWLLDNPTRNSTNAVYVNTSPACLRAGRTKSMGTESWTVPRTMRRLGLVDIVIGSRRRRFVQSAQYHVAARYEWTLTEKGQELAKEIKRKQAIDSAWETC